MVRYKKRRYYRKSTNVVKMKFQSFMDIQTSDTSMQIVTISAGGPEILRRLAPQFAAYKYYKIGNIAVKLVPATTLPVDPSGLSINAGGQGVNPVDQLTPGMMRITNGEDIFEDISALTTTEQDAIYNNMLLDPRWYKWMLQTGVKRHATPRYWIIGQLHQDKWPGMDVNVPHFVQGSGGSWSVDGTVHVHTDVAGTATTPSSKVVSGSTPLGMFQTGHTGRLGWMPTDGYQILPSGGSQPFTASPPEVEVFKILLPRARLTKYPYRLFITETVLFREPIVNFGIVAADGNMYRPLDVFHGFGRTSAMLPDYPIAGNLYPDDVDTGGNYGDN